jgi:lysozyme
MLSYRDIAKAQLKIDEGVRTKPYRDTVGKLSLGVGRNLDDKGLSMLEIDFLLENDLTDAERDARSLVVTFDKLSDARKAVLLNMALNLGRSRLAGFKRFLEAIHAEAWEQAAAEMLDSKWAAQTGDRAKRLAQQMREG